MIYNMDCLEYMKSLEDNSIDCIIADPPYNIGKGKMYENYEDDLTDNEYINFQLDVLNSFARFLDGVLFWNISYNKYPEECELLRGTEIDCFHDDTKVADFIDTLLILIEYRKDIK